MDRFERKILQKKYGSINENDEWRIKRKGELQTLFKEPSLSKHFRLIEWSCLQDGQGPSGFPGYASRNKNSEAPVGKMEGRRRKGCRN